VPGTYADLDTASLIVLVGSNAAWCHPVLFQRMIKNRRERGAAIVAIDPRRTATGDEADLFLGLKPGTDTALFCGLLANLACHGALDDAYIQAHTTGFAAALARAREIAPDVAATAAATGLSSDDVAAFFALFRTNPRVVTCYSQGVNQSAQGTDKVNAIINCHLATGRIGKPGMGPFSLTGQPNAMGGREVGGLANQLAAHMGFSPREVDRVRRFWRAPRMATREGLKAVQMFEAIERGSIKALWVMATNPAVSLPRAGPLRDALGRLELFVVSDNVASNDTINAGAHVLLPAAAWGEKDGTVTNSERRISRQRAFLPLPGEAMPDWRIVCEAARAMGFGQAFRYRSPAEVFAEHAALSSFENGGSRDFDIGGLSLLSGPQYDALEPVQWPVRASAARRDTRFFASGGFFTADRKAAFVAPEPPQLATAAGDLAFRLNTGRVRDQWHTMTRSGLSPRLGAHQPEPFVEVHPLDAAEAGLTDKGFAHITTSHGERVLRVSVSAGQQRGMLFAPIHWTAETASCGPIGDLVAPVTDRYSGQPEMKATPAAAAPVTLRYRGFVLARRRITLPPGTWTARVAVRNGEGCRFATNETAAVWPDQARSLFARGAELAEYLDEPRGIYRVAAFADGAFNGCLFVGPSEAVPQWDAIKALFEAGIVGDVARRLLLSGRSIDRVVDAGPLVCACFGVGLESIRGAIKSGAAHSVADIGRMLRAGTNCGSCLPELKRIVSHAAVPAPA
jgi:assimilatory nitrate reductase catalytic subunit